MKNPFKKYLKPYKGYTKRLLSNKQSWFLRPLYMSYNLFIKRHGNTYFSGFGEDIVLKNIFSRKKDGFYVNINAFPPFFMEQIRIRAPFGMPTANVDIKA